VVAANGRGVAWVSRQRSARGRRCAPLALRPPLTFRCSNAEIACIDAGSWLGLERLRGQQTAVDHVFAPMNRGCPVGDQEGDEFGRFLGAAGPADRLSSRPVHQMLAGGVLVRPRPCASRADQSRCAAVVPMKPGGTVFTPTPLGPTSFDSRYAQASWPKVTGTETGWPSRSTVSVTSSPGWRSSSAAKKSSVDASDRSSILTIRSPR
jgi:hypothetical protein